MQKSKNARSEVFYISKSFRKAVILPSARAWRVKDTDVAVRGYILCITKSKGLLFDKMTNLEPRLLTLTRNGLLIIYNKDDKGYVVDVKDAKVMTAKTDHFQTKRQSYRRCAIKLKFKYGSVSMIMFNEEIPIWRTAIATAHDGLLRSHLHIVGIHGKPPIIMHPSENAIEKNIENTSKEEQDRSLESPRRQDSVASTRTCVNADYVIPTAQASSEVIVEIPEDSEPITVIEAPPIIKIPTLKKLHNAALTPDDNTPPGTFDPTVCDSSYQWLHQETKLDAEHSRRCTSQSSNSGLFTELTDDEMSKIESTKSVRCGYTSVATLRTRLEAKIHGKTVNSHGTHIRKPKLEKNEIYNKSMDQTGIFLPTGKAGAIPNVSPPTKIRRVVRSQSESNLEHLETRLRIEVPATRSYDDSLIAVPPSEKYGSTSRPLKDWHNTSVTLEKYYSNQWWGQPLQA
ncbi:hypothetical protein DICVIV_05957 [Dictyocaulus viviparus]|uniref:DUF7778 domain-containing protein n=1 Tax=Dictyocaulus viviparus TaxID=29172 RepID=A0A0D8XVU1_DICVI|nr:hypothetical protein DICVIV_05957 [Dictyocaulus viviparus]